MVLLGVQPTKLLPIVLSTAYVISFSAVLYAYWIITRRDQHSSGDDNTNNRHSAYESLIGSTPCIELPHLSRIIGRRIFCKMESSNPGGTGKDRVALRIVKQAEQERRLPPPLHEKRDTSSTNEWKNNHDRNKCINNEDQCILQTAFRLSQTGGIVVEGTSGCTGIALATLCRLHGHACIVVLPDDQAIEKQETLRRLGALVKVVPTVSIANPDHYVNTARRLVQLGQDTMPMASIIWGNQFETPCNAAVHKETTGPELYRFFFEAREKDRGPLDAFCMGAGTGGTIAGVAQYFAECEQDKARKRATRWWTRTSQPVHHTRIILVDPVGSVLAPKVNYGVAYCPQQKERGLRRHRYDSLVEGIGLDRITANVQAGLPLIDSAYTIEDDQDVVDMAHWIVTTESNGKIVQIDPSRMNDGYCDCIRTFEDKTTYLSLRRQ